MKRFSVHALNHRRYFAEHCPVGSTGGQQAAAQLSWLRLVALHVGNFKAFANRQRIPLKPLTLGITVNQTILDL